MQTKHPLLLIILDGWGHRESHEANAIAAAHTPNWDAFLKQYPHSFISGSGSCVGLPAEQMGNSEVGHLNMGAGRIVHQDFTRIDQAVKDGQFAKNPVANEGITDFFIHPILDGRDVPPQSAMSSLMTLDQYCADLKCGRIVSLIGRFYAMDRDKRWERIATAYNLMTLGEAEHNALTAAAGLEAAYSRGETDEFVTATTIGPPVPIKDGDILICMNFRADRVREISEAFLAADFSGFKRQYWPKLNQYICLTQYDKRFNAPVAFAPQVLTNILGSYLSEHHLRQLRIAETEKYAHVTFFFNGGIETPFVGEDRILIPSPKVRTYDLQPEMSAKELTDALIKAIKSNQYDVIICNFANPDMVGHTGNFEATVQAIEVIDGCLEKIISALKSVNGEAIITADHGNAERMFNSETNQPHTAHTSDPVPFIYIGRPAKISKKDGKLSDIAPTMLYLLGLQKPLEMTGFSLLELQ
jgi:2,3-bisphosphoglycerate-independent phosphoglycerate mutase